MKVYELWRFPEEGDGKSVNLFSTLGKALEARDEEQEDETFPGARWEVVERTLDSYDYYEFKGFMGWEDVEEAS